VFFAQEREITLTWSIAEKYTSKSKLWVENFRPFSHQHLQGFFTQFL
jgi:hypothetical protein